MNLDKILKQHGLIKMGGAAEKFDDMTSAPGPKMLMYGDMDAGFFGVVPNNEFMPIKDAILELGSTTGTQRNENTDWFKFASEGKILFKTVKPVKRYYQETSQGDLQKDWGGGQTLEFGGNLYKSRFMKGIQDDSNQIEVDEKKKTYQVRFDDTEFTKLMIPLFESARNNGFIRNDTNRYIMEKGTDFWPIKDGAGLDLLDIGVSPKLQVNTELLSHKNLRLYQRYTNKWVPARVYNYYSAGREMYPSVIGSSGLSGGIGWWLTLELVEEEV